ncbi:MAG TPA: MFS transporter [Solirubrobacterales bacterium]|nr:MFS transporter [Solirubrobacterales bacterium]
MRPRVGRPAAGDGARAPQRLGLVLIAAGLAMFIVDLDFFALNLAVPKMAEELDTSATNMQWVISGYMLSGGAFLIPGGRLGDILGRRRMLIVGIAIFGGASAACGVAPSPGVLIAFRIVQGIGCALLFPITIAVVTNAFPEDRRKRAIGNLYGLAAIATAAGPFVGGGVTESLGWRWVFFINVPIAVAALALTVYAVRESRDETVPRTIDFAGLAAVALGIAAITFAVDKGETWGWASASVLGLIVTGIGLLVVFVLIERRVRFPLVDLALFRNRPYVVVTVLGTLSNIAFCVSTFASTLYLQQVRGYSPLAGGLIFLAASGTVAVAGPLSGRLGERFDVARLMAASIVLGAAGLVIVSTGPAIGVYAAGLLAFGFGYGLGWALTSVGTQTVVPIEEAGEASGVTLAIVVGMAGLGVAVAAALIETLTGGGTTEGEAIEGLLRWVAIGSGVAAAALAFVRGSAAVRPAT